MRVDALDAGEAAGLDSIQSALVDGRALRLGHGVRIAEDITVEFEENADDDGEGTVGLVTLGNVAGWVRDRGIALEICPSSNLQTGISDTIASHPFGRLADLGFAVTINCDNRLMSATTMSREYQLLSEAFGYGLDDLQRFTLIAARAAFLPYEAQERLAKYDPPT